MKKFKSSDAPELPDAAAAVGLLLRPPLLAVGLVEPRPDAHRDPLGHRCVDVGDDVAVVVQRTAELLDAAERCARLRRCCRVRQRLRVPLGDGWVVRLGGGDVWPEVADKGVEHARMAAHGGACG